VRFQQSVPLGIILPGDRVVMPSRSIRLHDHLLIRPTEVRDDAPPRKQERLVDLRSNESSVDDEVQYNVLELAASGCRRCQDAIEVRGPAASAEPSARRDDLTNAHAAQT
jgi:hypothetical protein